MSFKISDQDGITLVEVNGELTVGNRERFKQVVLERVESGERKFLMDFGESSYIDSTGLGALVSLSRKIREAGGRMRLTGLNEDLRTLFELTRLDTVFDLAETRAAAMSDF
ncbi:MAG TPA: STAS domain-containing protein [Gemmatimonadota bacterium]|nr:STAS domain-containing protein [Gemmatimonadota bacterium]